MDLPEHARINQAGWDVEAASYVEPARRAWGTPEISWGIWHVPEEEIGALPPADGLNVIELGCGTAYVSAWPARRGARPVGVDLSENQLATARAMQERHGIRFPLIHASAEAVPLPDAGFDLAVSEYGPRCGAIPTRGSGRRLASCAPAGGSCSSPTRCS